MHTDTEWLVRSFGGGNVGNLNVGSLTGNFKNITAVSINR